MGIADDDIRIIGIRGERETSPRETFIDSKIEHFGPGAQAFPDFLASLFPESQDDARKAARILIGWSVAFTENGRDWPILEILPPEYTGLKANIHIGFDGRRARLSISGSDLELKLPLEVFRRVSVGKTPQFLDSGPEFVEFASKGTAGYEEKLTIFEGGKIVYSRTEVTAVE